MSASDARILHLSFVEVKALPHGKSEAGLVFKKLGARLHSYRQYSEVCCHSPTSSTLTKIYIPKLASAYLSHTPPLTFVLCDVQPHYAAPARFISFSNKSEGVTFADQPSTCFYATCQHGQVKSDSPSKGSVTHGYF